MIARLLCVLACGVAAGCVGSDPAATLQITLESDDAVMVGVTTTVRATVTEDGEAGPTTVTLRFAEDPALPTLVPRTEGCTVSGLTVTCELGDFDYHARIYVDVTFPELPESTVQMVADAMSGTITATATGQFLVVTGVRTVVVDTLDPAQTGLPVDYVVTLGPSDVRWAEPVLIFNINEAFGAAATVTTAEAGCTLLRSPTVSSGARCELPALASNEISRRFTVVWLDMPLHQNPFPVDVTVMPGGDRTGVIGRAVETTAIQPATLSMMVTATPDPLAEGDPLTYTVELFNDSAQDLPATTLAVTFQSPFIGTPPVVRTPGCTTPAPYSVRCPVGALAAGGRRTTELEVLFPAVSQFILADLRLELDDVVLAERRFVQTRVIRGATVDLAVAAADADDPVTVGDLVALAASVGNHGGGDASGVTVTAMLPAALRFVAASPGCTHAAGTVTCDLGAVVTGGQRAISILADAITAGMATTTFAVDSASVDPYPVNDTATVSTTITTPTADLGVVMIDGGDPVSPFLGPSYGITATNHGPDVATGVTVVVQLPAGYSLSIVGQPGCSVMPGVVTCAVGSLASGASAEISFTGYGTPNTLASATATVTADQLDPVPGNNSDTETTQVTP